jgi:hypothetical protein
VTNWSVGTAWVDPGAVGVGLLRRIATSPVRPPPTNPTPSHYYLVGLFPPCYSRSAQQHSRAPSSSPCAPLLPFSHTNPYAGYSATKVPANAPNFPQDLTASVVVSGDKVGLQARKHTQMCGGLRVEPRGLLQLAACDGHISHMCHLTARALQCAGGHHRPNTEHPPSGRLLRRI